MSLVVQRFMESPLGTLRLVATNDALVAVYFSSQRSAMINPCSLAPLDHPVLGLAQWELDEYFGAVRKTFATPLAPRGTNFQALVWSALREIPFGETRTYAEIARRVGRGRAMRAVGGANANNPLSVFVPCHRVIGADGSLTGYDGGIDRKRWLLEHEGVAQKRS